MSNPEEDIKNLDLLATFHYVLGGIMGFFSCGPLVHVAMGVLMVTGNFPAPCQPSASLGWFLIIVGSFFIVLGWTIAICMLVTARNLKRKTQHGLCFVMACMECILIPFGTILGAFTIIALSKDSVKAAFKHIEIQPKA